ncbi:Piso0_004330 [Millerozyma farinosa CBS 7064]|uniref:Phosphotransferase n=1 Tax=Pichia sorbitophila (strain ATCC MYA-4447 / BCRC 22081 / CBS 7064 / NBRC 10061 / NRRL Y-12695) TaxID=559304 RepID=G8Y8I0_PICSO|nr:Piso0_004330 [Millerozyma farinosa CBS 7064]CCE84775.1 Piso0_004330 [Millerozyma farinosa CBS 7064]
MIDKKLDSAVKEIEDLFEVNDEFLLKATDEFINSMNNGLSHLSSTRQYMPMIPTFVTSIPTGKEKGLYLAGDLGGTNFRVCSVDLKGDHTYDLKQSKFEVPKDLMKGSTSDALFSYLASKVKDFLKEHHSDYDSDERLKLGFTFSFPVNQTALNKGTLIRWTKGFDIPDCVDKDIIELFQSHIDLLESKVEVVALANDTVGTLLSRAYTNNDEESNAHTIVGSIFGTGTNGAYFEQLDNIPKLRSLDVPKGSTGMVINTEWGSFDNELKVLPRTKYDDLIDSETFNKGYHLFEKRVSGMFLGELLRVTLLDLFDKGLLFTDLYKARGGSLPHRLAEQWQLNSEVLSYLEIDDSTDLKMSQLVLENHLRLPTSKQERIVIQRLTRAISKRAAYLSAIPLAAIVKRVKPQYENDNKDLEFGCDGSVVEFYPGFQQNILKAIDIINPLKGTNKKIHLRIAKDGSGVGAALCASTSK